jgi:hypothetical protein
MVITREYVLHPREPVLLGCEKTFLSLGAEGVLLNLSDSAMSRILIETEEFGHVTAIKSISVARTRDGASVSQSLTLNGHCQGQANLGLFLIMERHQDQAQRVSSKQASLLPKTGRKGAGEEGNLPFLVEEIMV